MPTDPVQPLPIEVAFTPEFKRNLRQPAKKYRQIKADVQPLLDDLMQGGTPGDQIPGVHSTVFKVRVKNSDSRKGKRGGYRIIYQQMRERMIVLITIYSKTEPTDITPQGIGEIILDYEAQPADQAAQTEPTRRANSPIVNDKDRNP
jgi:mRNA-degrading endonuclease RelE of RelBE toxin-antitoxin system